MISDKAIFLHKIKYGDSGLILKLYTKSHGTMAFLLQGLKGKNKSIPAILHPLAILEIQYSESGKSDLKRIKEIQVSEPLHHIRSDVHKSSLSFFLSEVCLKCFHEKEEHKDLFNFLEASVLLLENAERFGNFHLVFLVRLSRFLGFSPVGNFNGREFFDLQEGLFTILRPNHINYFEPLEAKNLNDIIETGFDFLNKGLTKSEKARMLNSLLKYFEIHVNGFGNLKTLDVLHQLNS
ncbi:MAG: DNA repair protein RecO [Salibacteraceae bacterium]